MEKLNIQLFAGYMFEIEVTITNGVFTYCSAGGDAIVDNGTRVTKLVASSSLPVTIIAEASSGYELPETTQLNANSDETVEYTWNKSTGTLSINSVSGECAVTGTLICTASAGDISKINLGGNTYNVKDAYLRKPNGENELIANNKIATTYLPDYILGQLLYGGTVTGAGVATLSTNAKSKLGTTSTSITLTNNTTAITGYESNEGIYYVVSSNGSFASLDLKTGDWLISTGSAWKKIDNTDEVTSVQISATSPVASSTSSSQTGSVSTTISLENNYGDTKNPYGNKSKNLVLASPSTTTGSPSFRSLVEDDIPSLSESKITNLTTDLAGKQETLVSGTNIKTINNTSLLGSGNINVIGSTMCYEEIIEPYLTFSSPSTFTLNVYSNYKSWDGTLYYSTDKTTWNTWGGTTTLNSSSSGDTKYLYLRGSGNTYITGENAYDIDYEPDAYWVLTGSNISCSGNIENLLDYQTVVSGQHPAMATKCYSNLFCYCTSLTTAPELPATTLAEGCYAEMFYDCTNLTTAPSLPATTLARVCYSYMFLGCTSLTTVPSLPATTLAIGCYANMFYNCSKIKLSTTQTGEYTQAYRIPTSGTGTTATDALTNMFYGTGGTFTSDPTINTTYYTSNTIIPSGN